MRGVMKTLVMLAAVVLVPAAAFAQATLAGTAKDTSGGVLPGVTVEASSPVLIEKARAATSMRPGSTGSRASNRGR